MSKNVGSELRQEFVSPSLLLSPLHINMYGIYGCFMDILWMFWGFKPPNSDISGSPHDTWPRRSALEFPTSQRRCFSEVKPKAKRPLRPKACHFSMKVMRIVIKLPYIWNEGGILGQSWDWRCLTFYGIFFFPELHFGVPSDVLKPEKPGHLAF